MIDLDHIAVQLERFEAELRATHDELGNLRASTEMTLQRAEGIHEMLTRQAQQPNDFNAPARRQISNEIADLKNYMDANFVHLSQQLDRKPNAVGIYLSICFLLLGTTAIFVGATLLRSQGYLP